MPRPKKPGAPEPKRRSRNGCWPCKARKVKCGEEKPSCANCRRQDVDCDYSIRLNWDGRSRKKVATEHVGLNSDATNTPLSPSNPHSGQEGETPASMPIMEHVFAPLVQYQGQNQSHGTKRKQSLGEAQRNSAILLSKERLNPSPINYSFAPTINSQTFSSKVTHPDQQPSLLAAPGRAVHAGRSRISDTPIFLPLGIPARESPGLSSTSEEISQQFSPVSTADIVNTPSDIQRVSVKSLLSQPCLPAPPSNNSESYGLDCGQPDLDVHREFDFLASLNGKVSGDASDGLAASHFVCPEDSGTPSSSPEDASADSCRAVTTVFSKGGYYAKPVPIYISRLLSPLPSTLLDSPINLLYFHHFINHTARILVPHNCPKNPFATVLPAMAIGDENVLNLLLAYSASHRARLLGHAEPSTRIARWTSGVFPSLRHDLDDPKKKVSAATLATAVMLVSLKVISPATFEVPIRWESHLMTAREVFLARQNSDSDNFSGPINTFLHRWLGYLDIFGSLSSRRAEAPLYDDAYWSPDASEEPGPSTVVDKDFEIDCFTGFTPRCCSFLARLGELTHQCDNVRVDPGGRLFTSWTPSVTVLSKAEELLEDMEEASPSRTLGRRTHHHKPVDANMAAVDEAYRLAGMIHLHRRVFGRESSDPVVKDLVDALVDALNLISRGGQEEVCVLFPLFTAGCESQNASQRQQAIERVHGFESVGMKQIQRARKLMERSWQEGLPWNVLADGEFLG